MAASCRSRASCPAASSDGAELWRSASDTAKVSGHLPDARQGPAKLPSARAGDTVALGKLDGVATGQTLTSAKGGMAQLVELEPPQPVFAFSLRPKERKDEVKMSAAIPAPCRGGPVADAPSQPGFRRDGAFGPWRDASARGARAARRQEPDRRRGPAAGGALSRDDPQAGHASAAGTRSSPAAMASSATW